MDSRLHALRRGPDASSPVKLRRVFHRSLRRGDRSRVLSVGLAAVTLGALGTGVWWIVGGTLDLGPWGLFHLHVALGRWSRHCYWCISARGSTRRHGHLWRPPGRSPVRWLGDRGGTPLASQGPVNDALDTAGADRRYTGSREEATDDGNRFPVTSWVADDPDPVDAADWSLSVAGRVAHEASYVAGDLSPDATESAVLDCTSGWYSGHEWQGVRVGDLLDAADPDDAAAWVQFRSITAIAGASRCRRPAMLCWPPTSTASAWPTGTATRSDSSRPAVEGSVGEVGRVSAGQRAPRTRGVACVSVSGL